MSFLLSRCETIKKDGGKDREKKQKCSFSRKVRGYRDLKSIHHPHWCLEREGKWGWCWPPLASLFVSRKTWPRRHLRRSASSRSRCSWARSATHQEKVLHVDMGFFLWNMHVPAPKWDFENIPCQHHGKFSIMFKTRTCMFKFLNMHVTNVNMHVTDVTDDNIQKMDVTYMFEGTTCALHVPD